ncbi:MULTISPECIES: TIGR03619 family F420-dependent LLM class oxidoreductase [unclassified Blastococcus]
MHIGISAYDIAARDLVDLAAAADELGFESLWLGEHVVLPVGYSSEHPTSDTSGHHHHTGPIVDPSTKLLDPLVALAGCAAVTRSILLATGIYLVPLRSPLLVARMAHTLQELSGGRFRLGAGAGWLEEEFAAVGVPFAGRGARLEEHLDVLRAALAGGPFEHRGPLYQFQGLQLCEEPVDVPVVLGGNGERALRRAAERGDGWFASGTPAYDDACRWREQLLAYRRAAGRTDPFPTYVRIPDPDPDAVARYEAAGFTGAVVWADQVWPAQGDSATKRAALAEAARRLGVQPQSRPQPVPVPVA